MSSEYIDTLLLGKPGSGKTTQASQLSHRFGACSLGLGMLVDNALKSISPSEAESRIAKSFAAGTRIRDEDITGLVVEKVLSSECSKGYSLHGYPRTNNQATNVLDSLARIGRSPKVVELDTSDSVCIDRMNGRLTHPGSGRVYHDKLAKPKVHLKDDITGESLVEFQEDRLDNPKKRLAMYNAMFPEIRATIAARGSNIAILAGDSDISSVFAGLCKCMQI